MCGQVEVYGPSNVPVASPTDFLQQLSVHLNCEELGIDGILRWNDPTGNKEHLTDKIQQICGNTLQTICSVICKDVRIR